MSKCQSWLGHRYEGRYDEGSTEANFRMSRTNADEISKIIRAKKPITYVRDICVRCGHVIERAKP